MANYITESLEEGEKIVMKGRLHWSSIASYLFWSILFIVGGIVCLFLQRTEAYMGGAALIVLGVVTYLIGWVVRTKTEFAVTTTRFIQKDGIFNIKMTEIPLGKIETVNFYQTFWQRLLGTGCLELLGGKFRGFGPLATAKS